VKGMMQNRKLSKSIADVSWGEFRRPLSYKCKQYGTELVIADRYFPSTRLCSSCWLLNRKQKLHNRIFECSSCGLRIDRDLNAAINLDKHHPDWRKRIVYPESTPGGVCGEGVKPDHPIALQSVDGDLDEADSGQNV